MKGNLWIISEAGPIAKIYFDTEKKKIKPMELNKKDFEKGFLISAYVLRSRKKGEKNEFGYVKENIVYHLKGSKIFVLVTDSNIANSPYIYGFLRELGNKLYDVIDGVAIVDEVEKLVKKILFNIPKPLPPVSNSLSKSNLKINELD